MDKTEVLSSKKQPKTRLRIPGNRPDSLTLLSLLSMAAKKTKPKEKSNEKRWSRKVTKESNALDLEKGVFTLKDPHKIALSLKRSAEKSERRKSSPFRSAMSMLTFYINRAGKDLPKAQVKRLESAKDELRELFEK